MWKQGKEFYKGIIWKGGHGGLIDMHGSEHSDDLGKVLLEKDKF